jgi:hypothetical protein
MAANKILTFSPTDIGTNLLTDTEYAADSQRTNGNQPGTARSKLVNKALRQASLIAAGLSQLMADSQGTDLVDTLTPAQIATIFKATLSAANIFATAPQFNATTLPATTAFVQRAIGNYQFGQPISIVGNFAVTDVGGAFYIQAAGTYGLPALSAVNFGSSFSMMATVDGVVIDGNGADQFLSGSAALSTVTLNNGDSAVFTKIGGFWAITGGTASARGSQGDYGRSLSANGWQRLPSGLIIQFFTGNGSASAGSPFVSRVFPIAFPTACIAVTAMCDNPAAYLASFNGKSTSGVNIGTFENISGSTSNAAYTAIAIGY